MNLRTFNILDQAIEIKKILDSADAIVVGVGSGLTSADGNNYYGSKFSDNFKDFIEKYHFLDMLQASLYDFGSWETYWAFHSRFAKVNFLDLKESESFLNLKKILENKNFFIITTNSDSFFEKSGFDNQKIFYIQGKYNLMQCSKMCKNFLYQDDELILKMVQNQKNMKVDYNLLPKCPECNAFLEINKRISFKGMVEDQNFDNQKANYNNFIEKNKDKNLVFLEIGVGFTTPQLIKLPFQEMTKKFKNAKYLVINQKKYRTNKDILEKSYFFHEDIKLLLQKITKQE
ncbi:deacetylase SIR2 [Mesomycoplasma ovipneumoniae]|uniref:deacetylase SIR2 n=1 Tax=Mesomycoplasma ovipneumoniae TaxID=29562 RepID=UPI003080E1AC